MTSSLWCVGARGKYPEAWGVTSSLWCVGGRGKYFRGKYWAEEALLVNGLEEEVSVVGTRAPHEPGA